MSNLVAIDLFKVVTSGRSFGTNLALLRKRVRIEKTNLVVMVFKLALIFGSLLPVGTASLFFVIIVPSSREKLSSGRWAASNVVG